MAAMPDTGPPVLKPPPEEIAQILAPTTMFARFDQESLLAVATECGFSTYPAGTTIMREGDPGSFALVIVEGEVNVYVELPAGPVHVATLGRNRMVGELGAFSDMPRTATIVARTYLIVVRIEQDSMLRLSMRYPSIGVALVRDLGGQVATMNHWLARLKFAAEALERDEYDTALFDELSDQTGELAAFARAFAGMAREIRAKQNRREEMRAASEIQQSILPAPLAPGEGGGRVDLHAEMHPAREVGGDFYDFYMIDDDHLAVTVADVSGKGIPASLFMAVSRTVMRSISGATDMATGMMQSNKLLSTQNTACMFVTMFHGVLDLRTGRLRYCNAGHNPPYLTRAHGERETLGSTGIPFGIDADWPYRTEETTLAAGDSLFLFSDGITEAFSATGEEFGTERLEAALERARDLSTAELVRQLLDQVGLFATGAVQSDDITCLALTFRPAQREAAVAA
jgi:serine phosphatase RsbU (regulator of sigma subunit)